MNAMVRVSPHGTEVLLSFEAPEYDVGAAVMSAFSPVPALGLASRFPLLPLSG